MSATVAAGDRLILLEAATGRRFLVELDGKGARKDKGLGVYDPARLEGTAWGDLVQIAGKDLHVLRPTLPDLHATLRRKAQIIQPKDSSRIAYELGVGPGDRVLESGIGSGAATLALLQAVAPGGEVVAQELREDFADWSRANVERAGHADGLTVTIGDLTQGLADGVVGPFQGCLLDQPEPWLAIPNVATVMAPGGRIVAYCPQVSQMEKAAKAMQEVGCVDVRCMELIERAWEVKEFGSRPSFDGLGHTGFLVVGVFVNASE